MAALVMAVTMLSMSLAAIPEAVCQRQALQSPTARGVSGDSFVVAFAFMHKVTGDQMWLDRARLVADWRWRHRDPSTHLTVDAPSTKPRYDATHCFTTVPGPHAAALLRAYELPRRMPQNL